MLKKKMIQQGNYITYFDAMSKIFIWPLPESWCDDFVSVKCTKLLGLIIAMERAVITSLWKTSGSSSLPSRLQLFRHCTALLSKDWSWWKEDRKWHLSYLKADFTHCFFSLFQSLWLSKLLKLLLQCQIFLDSILHYFGYVKIHFPARLLFYLVVVVGCATGVQACEKSLGLVLHTCRGWHGQQEGGQLQSCSLILFLFRYTDKQSRLLTENMLNIYFFWKENHITCIPFH